MRDFNGAPKWFNYLLNFEDLLLKRFKNYLPRQEELTDIKDANQVVNNDLDREMAERMVPGSNQSFYMIQHVARYLWAMDIVRGREVVDLGSGDGYGTYLLSWVAKRSVGVDVDLSLLESSAKKYGGVFEDNYQEINSHQGPAPTYSLLDLNKDIDLPRADFAVCFEVLEHLEDPEGLIKNVARSNIDELILSIPNPLIGGSHINPHHLQNWSLKSFKDLLKQHGAREIDPFHQNYRGYQIKRGAFYNNGFWLFRVRF
jgi:SAM-dependent methyltransferase